MVSSNSAKVYGLVPIDIIRGLVHIVHSNDIVNQISPHDEKRREEQAFSTRSRH